MRLKGLSKYELALYSMQAFSTFSFAILFSSLSIYLTKEQGLNHVDSNNLVGIFLALNFVYHLVGGALGGSLISNRSLFVLTILFQAGGMIALSLVSASGIIFALSLYLVGCGLNTTCYNGILTQYFKNDNDRELGFFLSYAFMNVGFTAGYFFGGIFELSGSYSTLFDLGFLSCLVTLGLTYAVWGKIKDTNTKLSQINNTITYSRKKAKAFWGSIVLFPVSAALLKFPVISNNLVITASLMMLVFIAYLAYQEKNKQLRQRLITFNVLTVTSIVFWMIYYTGPMGVALFVKNNVDKALFGFDLPTQWVLNLNSIVVIVFSPVLCLCIQKARSQNINITTIGQFILGFIILSASFLLLSSGIIFSNDKGLSSLIWVIFHFFAQGIGELLVGPVGYAMVARIAPNNLQGLLMGMWMMVSGVSASLSHYFSNQMVISNDLNPLSSNIGYYNVFNKLAVFAIFGAVLLFFINKKYRYIESLTYEADEPNDSPSLGNDVKCV